MTSQGSVQDLIGVRVAEIRKAQEIPGVVVLAFTDDRIIAEVASGRRSAEDQSPMTADTLFRMYSLTKMITASAVLRLQDRGRLGLDATLSEVAPSLVRYAPELLGDLTPSQLLSHTSGLPDGSTGITEYSRDLSGLAEQTGSMATSMTAIARPGEIYSYSNYGYSVLGAAIEEMTGKQYPQVVNELVGRPLGLTSLCFDPITAMTYPLSQQHPVMRGQPVVDHWYGESVRMYPAAMAFLSPRDLARLGRMHLSGGLVPESSKEFLSPRSLKDQQSRHVDMGLVDDRHYGLGMYVGPSAGGVDCVGHEGYFTGMWSSLAIYPGQNCGVVWCDNRGDSRELSNARREAIAAICQELGVPAHPRARPATHEIPDEAVFIGTYTRLAARPIQVERDEDGLRLRLGNEAFSLTHHAGSIYRIDVPDRLMTRRPLTPHAGSSTASVIFHSAASTQGSLSMGSLSINGIAYGQV